MTEEIIKAVDGVFNGIEAIIEHGGYREKQEAAGVLVAMDWFRNFGYEDVEFRYVELRERLEDELAEKDWPDVWHE